MELVVHTTDSFLFFFVIYAITKEKYRTINSHIHTLPSTNGYDTNGN